MTDSMKGAGGPLGPPWSVDVLADLHAGVLDPAESARLWPQVNADPEARAILAALDEVKVGLGRLGNAPVEPMPAQYAARLDAAIEAEVRASGRLATAPGPGPQQAPLPPTPPAQVVDLAAARKRRNRMAAWGAGVLTAAAAAAAIAFVAVPGNETSGSPSAQGDASTKTEQPGPGTQGPLALSNENLGTAIGPLTGKKEYGGLKDEQGVKACLEAHGVPVPDSPVGVGPVKFEGRDAMAVLLGSGEIGHFRIVVVEPTCTADNPGEKLAEDEVP